MRNYVLLFAATALMAPLAACGHEDTASDADAPDFVMEGYPLWLGQALDKRRGEIEKASKKAFPGFAPYYVIRQTRLWKAGSTVTVSFYGGSPQIWSQIEQAAQAWTAPGYANLKLSFRNADGSYRTWKPSDQIYASDIRIAFATDDDNGSFWSAVGLDSRDPNLIKPYQASMNLHGYDMGLPSDWRIFVLHEFGHALGFEHEHQSPAGSCDFRFDDDPGYIPTRDSRGAFINDPNGKRPGLYTWLSGFPNKWPRARTTANLTQLQPSSAFSVGPFDRASIMLYSFDPFMFRRGAQSPCQVSIDNAAISPQDKVGVSRAYPVQAAAMDEAFRKSRATFDALVKDAPPSSEFSASIESRKDFIEQAAVAAE